MKHVIWILATLPFILPLATQAQQPPVIDRELLFGDPEISGAQISPDGKYIAFLKPLSKTRNIWVKKTQEPFSAATMATGASRGAVSNAARVLPTRCAGRSGKRLATPSGLVV